MQYRIISPSDINNSLYPLPKQRVFYVFVTDLKCGIFVLMGSANKLKLFHEHAWDLSPKEAIHLQNKLRQLVSLADDVSDIHFVAGVDAGYEENGSITRAAIVILDFPSLELVESSISYVPTQYPYVPGLLSFRELPAVLEALSTIKHKPQLFLCDGQGLAHQRRFGIACHLGVLTNCATIGVGKTRLVGTHESVPDEKGAWVPLVDKDEEVGAVLRTRQGVKPVYVSSGHRLSTKTAVEYVLACTTKYKLPETTRLADKLASNR